ncbi:Uncharacterised protein [Mycobacteroides abscessus subsp. abscessus]|uniref:DUF7882 family protein n=1 Tax=Mycobacteroides abscessus TaxID=36809 RepID=UPI00092BD56E|nr:hypothetical protein [Mycobacteroides abscessus]SHY99146.1 Uncharacterised protein [Mycobacteroides abscessus subsp. abscessus]SIH30458.1 Uncharacterised protein [Mycobacteroides abscessus subsp. abscessus]SKN43544.1 Uncharacterised protein [Mycobacteroides abscessus subsp. abscessus]SLB70128.1 Uncharacterised protein [Mycobacteroides abscessus subsp. abscessus]
MATLVLGTEPDRVTLNGIDARVLATLQVATFQRFSEGFGFFLNLAGEDQAVTSLWCHPTIPIRFVYENCDEPVDADDKLAEVLIEIMAKPDGVTLGDIDGEGRPFRYYWPIGSSEDSEETVAD